MYELARCIFAIPPTEVEIEKNFSNLNFIFTQRRQHLSEDHLDAILQIHLKKDLFFILNEEELVELL